MQEYPRPIIVVSRCLGFDNVRYDGSMVQSSELSMLLPHATFITVCPEVDIGLGVPRPTLRLVRRGQEVALVQPDTGYEFTEVMKRFSQDFLESQDPDGFILKGGSPSSGLRRVKVYASEGPSPVVDHSPGIFGGAVSTMFPLHPKEDEGRLRNIRVWDHFLTQLFTLSRFRQVLESDRMRDLVDFHSRHKYLLMAHNQELLRDMGRVISGRSDMALDEVLHRYRKMLMAAVQRAPSFNNNVNILLHMMGHMKEVLTSEEKAAFLDSLELYRQGRVPVTGPKNILRAWVARVGDDYLRHQTYFCPYPSELIRLPEALTDRGRDMWAEPLS